MNNVYLKKIVNQEKLNTKIQLVQEHLDLAREESIQLQENIDDINNMSMILEREQSIDSNKLEWSPPNDKVAEFINNFPESNAVRKLSMGRNPFAYEVQVKIDPKSGDEKKSQYNNLFRFYENGTVYDYNLMTRLGWKFSDNEIQIISKDPNAIVSLSDEIVLATIDSSGKFNNSSYGAEESSGFLGTGKKPKKNPALDTFQTILDWAGLIPVIGDGLDVLNAIIYFVRDKWFEGFLSLIAIIPIIGSVLKLGVKGAFKATATGVKTGLKSIGLVKLSNNIKKWWLNGSMEAMEKVGTDLIEKGAMSPKELKRVSDMFGGFSNKLKAMLPWTKKTIGDGAVLKTLDNGVNSLAKGQTGLRQASEEVGKNVVKNRRLMRQVAKNQANKISPKILSFLSFTLLPKLRRLPFYPAKKLAKMAKKTEERFKKTMAKNPNKLGVMAKLLSERSVNKVAGGFNVIMKNSGQVDNITKIFKTTPGLEKYLGSGKNADVINYEKLLDSANDTSKFFKTIGKTKGLEDVSKDFGKEIATISVNSNSPAWLWYKNADINDLISSQTAQSIQFQFAKNVDIIWNEMQSAGNTLGIESSEQLQKFGIVPLTKWVIASASPGGYTKMQKAAEYARELIGTGKTTSSVVVGQFIQLKDLNEYPPLGANRYTYKADSE